MWQDIIVFTILAVVGALTIWRFYQKFTGKASCCGGGCTCKGDCGSSSGRPSSGSGKGGDGLRMNPHQGSGGCCGCSH
jgi:hypothetical protein